MASLQDYSLIKSHVEAFQQDLGKDPQGAFYYFVLNLILGLQDDEIEDAITDNSYLTQAGPHGGHDRGIDAAYIDESDVKPTIHLFNFKFTTKFEKTSGHFPAGEIDKILTFLDALMSKDPNLKDDVNPVLFSKVEEIWKIFETTNPDFVVHLCANLYEGLEKNERKRFERGIGRFSNFTVQSHLMLELVNRITRKDKELVDAKIKAIDKNYFEKSDGDIRALVVDVDVRDLIRIVLDNEEIRDQADVPDYEKLREYQILEDAFEDNVRVYLRLRARINRNIKATALSDDSHRFFYFNNGITITCDRFHYLKGARAPVVELKSLQVVNGSQTIHAVYEAFLEDPSRFEDMDVLCRIYETQNSALSTNIAEYTNSQTPVSSRDIRSIDLAQQKLESQFLTMGYYYERKKNQYSGQPRHLRIDAEKVGQVLFTFYNKMPAEAKNKKRLIFAEKYEDIFNDNIDADAVLLPYELFRRIEEEKNMTKAEILAASEPEVYETESFFLYASYYILYIMGELACGDSIPLTYDNVNAVWALYPKSVSIVRQLIDTEQKALIGHKDKYNHAVFFKSNRPKKLFEEEFLD